MVKLTLAEHPAPSHPGVTRTPVLLHQLFWWPSMKKDTKEFIPACPTCSQHKSSQQAPPGLLQPLPVPHWPWSHISLDFVTGLPASHGNTVILTVVNCSPHSITQTTNTQGNSRDFLNHVFRLHGLPCDLVSDRRPQFTSCFWSEFCNLLGAKVSLSSGFPKYNVET